MKSAAAATGATESQGDSLMRRKLERQPGSLTLPTNDVDAAPAGRYFARLPAEAPAPAAGQQPTTSDDHHNSTNASIALPQLAGTTPRGFAAVAMASMTASQSASIPPYRRHLESRQREIEAYIDARIQEAIDDQRMEETMRSEACRQQRDVERLKLRQRVKQRVELQAAARQPVPPVLLETMQVRLPPSNHRDTHTSAHRKALRDVPTASFLAHNADRLSATGLHREVCITAERLKAQVRVSLEEYVGTDFAKKRNALWNAGDGRPTDSVRCPTAQERHRHEVEAIAKRRAVEADEAEVLRSMHEVTRLDDVIWDAESRRLASGQRRQLSKDVTFTTAADFRRRGSPQQATK